MAQSIKFETKWGDTAIFQSATKAIDISALQLKAVDGVTINASNAKTNKHVWTGSYSATKDAITYNVICGYLNSVVTYDVALDIEIEGTWK